MSYSPLDDFFDFSSDIHEEEENQADEEPEPSSPSEYDVAAVSSVDSQEILSVSDSMSLNSDTLQDFGSIISLPPGTLAEIFHLHRQESNHFDEGNGTIVSSAPSGATLPAPEASQNIWAISPHPSFFPGNVQAMSTVCTDNISYQRLLGDSSSMSTTTEDDASSAYRSLPAVPHEHERITYEAIANQLRGDDTTQPSTGKWYSHLTDSDWEQMRDVAKIVLATNGRTTIPRLSLPPTPMVNESGTKKTPMVSTYNASTCFPSNFFCPYCKELLIGAMVLDCGCVMCTICWEANSDTEENKVSAKGEDYVWVENRHCNACMSPVTSAIPCPALDTAIVQVVQNLDTSRDSKLEGLKLSCFSRLEAWRQTVLARNKAIDEREMVLQDEMLARLIAEEEKILYSDEPRANAISITMRRLNLLFLGQAAIAFVAATVTSIALKSFIRRS